MLRRVIALIAAVALALGLALGFGLVPDPTEASTSHSMAYHCSITRPAGHTVLGYQAWTVVNGVIMRVKCRSNNFNVFGDADRCWIMYATTHNRGGYYIC